ncbi:GNAT family N-acetyltransferase [Pelagibacterium limicola]|uniref:GNAT family N-acetyltransferase n=1 Tax=Pelagibacterium limicola TaxID=2791022 RepID=UPI0018B0011D|nr:GNAT family N-acetyltransferase [Pelagibacterium limicola]
MPDLTVLPVPVFSPLCNLGFALRREVFVIEQNVPEELEHDADDLAATHIVGIAEGAVVAVLRILWNESYAKIGRVAVAASHRGHGLGAKMIRFAVEYAAGQGQSRCYLESQSDKVAFYERLGFVAYGDEFMDAGIPHLRMKNF